MNKTQQLHSRNSSTYPVNIFPSNREPQSEVHNRTHIKFRLSILQSMILPQSSAIYNDRWLFQYTKCKGNTVHNSCYINISSSCTRRNRTGLGVLGLYTNTNTVFLFQNFFVKMSIYCSTISKYSQTWRILVSMLQNTLRIQSIIYVQYSAYPLYCILYTVHPLSNQSYVQFKTGPDLSVCRPLHVFKNNKFACLRPYFPSVCLNYFSINCETNKSR